MTYQDFVKQLAERTGLESAEAERLVQNVVSRINKEANGGSVVSIQSFGNFETKVKAERKMYNPSTKSFRIIPKKSTLGFKMSGTLKDRINA